MESCSIALSEEVHIYLREISISNLTFHISCYDIYLSKVSESDYFLEEWKSFWYKEDNLRIIFVKQEKKPYQMSGKIKEHHQKPPLSLSVSPRWKDAKQNICISCFVRAFCTECICCSDAQAVIMIMIMIMMEDEWAVSYIVFCSLTRCNIRIFMPCHATVDHTYIS